VFTEVTASSSHGAGTALAESSMAIESRLEGALQQLRQVDLILEQLGVFWANTEVVLELLTKKGQLAEQFVGFAHKPQLMARFRQLMNDYGRFWEGIQRMCRNYISGASLDADNDALHGFDDVHKNENEYENSTGGNPKSSFVSNGKGSSGNKARDGHSVTPSMGESAYDFTGVDEGLERFMDRKISTPPRMKTGVKSRSQDGEVHNQIDGDSNPNNISHLIFMDQVQNSRLEASRRESPDPLVAQMSSGDDVNDMAAEFRRNERIHNR